MVKFKNQYHTSTSFITTVTSLQHLLATPPCKKSDCYSNSNSLIAVFLLYKQREHLKTSFVLVYRTR